MTAVEQTCVGSKASVSLTTQIPLDFLGFLFARSKKNASTCQLNS